MSEEPKLDAVDRKVRVLIVASAFLLLLEGALILVAAAPGLPEDRPTILPEREASAQSPSASTESALAARRALELDNLRRLTPDEASLAAFQWAQKASKEQPITDRDVEDVLPPAAFFLARTASPSDVDDIRASAADDSGAFSRAYKPIAQAIPGSNAAGARVEAALDVIYGFRTSPAPADSGSGKPPALHPPIARDKRWIAPEEELKRSHQNALDIFFHRAGGWGSSEKGPLICSMSPGVVVAAANDWAGGETAAKYRRGGLTPRAGNGAIIYDPHSGRYYTYFHLHDVSVQPGQIVLPGSPLGHGGNTGTNARMRGHGCHLHLEIWDARRNEYLDCYTLRDLILSL